MIDIVATQFSLGQQQAQLHTVRRIIKIFLAFWVAIYHCVHAHDLYDSLVLETFLWICDLVHKQTQTRVRSEWGFSSSVDSC